MNYERTWASASSVKMFPFFLLLASNSFGGSCNVADAYVSQRAEFPFPTKQRSWVQKFTGPWKPFIRTPNHQYLPVFRTLACDIPTWYYAIVASWHFIAPIGKRRASRAPTKVLVFSMIIGFVIFNDVALERLEDSCVCLKKA